MPKRSTLEEFIAKARAVHGDKYDYSRVVYTNNRTKVCIICPEHGEFWQSPEKHTLRRGCPACGVVLVHDKQRSSVAEFVIKAKKIHGDKYDYSKVNYQGNKVKVCISCPEHGDFWQVPNSHLSGRGCPVCGKVVTRSSLRDTLDSFIKKARIKHGDKYDYSLVKYVDSIHKVKIVCSEHGVFEQTPAMHLSENGCPKCGIIKAHPFKNTETFIADAQRIHGDKYDYSKTGYVSVFKPVVIICPKHGDFNQTPNSHLHGHGCPRCSHHISKGEQEMMDWIKQYFPDACHATRILAGKDIDIYIPSKKFGIEYNGIYFHSAQFRDKYDHLRKLETAQQLGIRLVQFWDFEWENKKDIVKSIILNALGVRSNVVYARSTKIVKLPSSQARRFCVENHIHGFRAANEYLGLVDDNDLLALMSRNTDGEMVRFVVKNGYSVLGAFSKLLRHSSVTYSFVDRRIFTGAGYLKNGFVLQRITQPNYFYENDGQYAGSRQMYQKHKLSKILPIFDPSLTEVQNMANNDYYPVYDCGNLVLIRQEESTED